MGHASRGNLAFTLIELMVVVLIIGLLIGILLPTLAQAVEAGRSVLCSSNLRELGKAWYAYARDNNGTVMPGRDYTDSNYYKFWSGRQTKSIPANDIKGYDQLSGYISPYVPDGAPKACPSYKGPANNGQLGYGYNWIYLSYYDGNPDGTGARRFYETSLSDIQNPCRKVVFADCARPICSNASGSWKTGGRGIETTPFLNPPSWQNPRGSGPWLNFPSFHGRHNGKGNVCWADVHVSQMIPKWLKDPYTYSGATLPAADLKRCGIGDLDEDGDINTNELFQLE